MGELAAVAAPVGDFHVGVFRFCARAAWRRGLWRGRPLRRRWRQEFQDRHAARWRFGAGCRDWSCRCPKCGRVHDRRSRGGLRLGYRSGGRRRRRLYLRATIDVGEPDLQRWRLRPPLIPRQFQAGQPQAGNPEAQRQDECMKKKGKAQRQRETCPARIGRRRACADIQECIVRRHRQFVCRPALMPSLRRPMRCCTVGADEILQRRIEMRLSPCQLRGTIGRPCDAQVRRATGRIKLPYRLGRFIVNAQTGVNANGPRRAAAGRDGASEAPVDCGT